jgi:carboxyvinyl-carboxyphosphonate phosphorylmutase
LNDETKQELLRRIDMVVPRLFDDQNRICRAGNLAVLVDTDHGYGNALNVRRTAEELETAGICAMSIEDTVLPRPYGSSGKPSLSSIDEGVGKDEGGAVGAPRQEPRHRRTYQRAGDCEPRRSGQASQGL